MARLYAVAAVAGVLAGLAGCASAWDTVSSKRFRDKPYHIMFGKDDPLEVLRTNPDGDERARAMRKLTEPAAAGRPDAEQEEVVQLLTSAATTDPSPWVRVAAIDALGRFKDRRAVEILTTAYDQAPGGVIPATPAPKAAGEPGLLADRLGLHGPQGFPPDQIANIRGRAVDALARTNRPDAVGFLARVAGGGDAAWNDDPAAKDFVRQRAVAGLGQMRQKEAVVALAKVLSAESGKDIALADLAHGGLVGLTGKALPADPEKWDAVVQAGFEIAPEQNSVQRAVGLDLKPK